MPRKKAKLSTDEISGKNNFQAAEIQVHENRLANFTNPIARTLTNQQKAKNDKSKSKASKTKQSLVRLMDFPMELFLEIASNLEPIDILHFSRVSRHFRSLLNPKNSRLVWAAARRNIPNLPDCPSDLTEAQYASLMFEHVCQACGMKTVKVDYCLRLRFCGPCFHMNVSKGGTIIRASQWGKIPPIVYELLPRKTPAFFPQGLMYTSATNSRHHMYYAPEFRLIAKRYRSLEHDKYALDRFIKQQRNSASQLMQSGKVLLDWDESCKKNRQDEKADLAASRKKSIEAKLNELGWDEDSFPRYWESQEWRKIMDQPRELTARIWAQVSPKLVKILEELREERREVARKHRFRLRSNEFSIIWEEHLLSYPPESRYLFPNCYDVVFLPSVASALEEDDGNAAVTSEKFNAILPGALLESEQHKLRVQSNLLKALKGSSQAPEPNITPDETDSVAKLEPLYHVSAMFSCWRCHPLKLFIFPDLLSHSHIRDQRWVGDVKPLGPEVQALIAEILRIFDLPVDTARSSEVFKQIDGRFLCNCESTSAGNPLDFLSLVNHIYESNQRFRQLKIDYVYFVGSSDGVDHLRDDHALKRLPSLLSLAPPNANRSLLDVP